MRLVKYLVLISPDLSFHEYRPMGHLWKLIVGELADHVRQVLRDHALLSYVAIVAMALELGREVRLACGVGTFEKLWNLVSGALNWRNVDRSRNGVSADRFLLATI